MRVKNIYNLPEEVRIMIAVYKPRADIIMSVVAYYFGVTVAAIKSPNRSEVNTNARHWFHFMARERLNKLGLSGIGYYTGGRDHATVCKSIRKIGNELRFQRRDGSFIYPEIQAIYHDLNLLIDTELKRNDIIVNNEMWATSVGNSYNIHNN